MNYKLHLLTYKNYYNRQVKRLKTLSEYLVPQYLIKTVNVVNFKPDDWLSTTQIVNTNVIPNYVIAEASDGSFTRWFVIEAKRTREGQYNLTLRRDVICDELGSILNSTSYVEKGFVESNNPLILNLENFNANQIKTKEIQLYDNSGVSWVAIYFSNFELENYDVEIDFNSLAYKIVEEVDLASCLAVLNTTLSTFLDKNIYFDKIASNVSQRKKIDYETFLKISTMYGNKFYNFKIDGVYHKYKITFHKFYDNHCNEYYRMYLSEYPVVFPSYFSLNIQGFQNKVLMIPYSDMYFETNFVADLCRNIQVQKGSNIIYDTQILPYNPLFKGVGINRYPTDTDFSSTDVYNTPRYFGDLALTMKNALGQDYKLYGVHAYEYNEVENMTTNIYIPEFITEPSNKLLKNLYSFRLCSPNYNGIFEFNYADMLTNNVDLNLNFNVDLNYKPYVPYIHVTPFLSGLYGKDYNDARGLTCSGEFSLEQASDAWANYKLQNKNYQNQFDRQIQNMETKRKYERVGEVTGAIAGTVKGSLLGTIGGGIFGTIAGGIASGLGGVADIALSEGLYNEALDYTKDMYNYNLQNIQALPQSITKINSISYNNKNVPFLEVYECTDIEKKAFENKILFNGMTVNVIGKLKDYVAPGGETYVKGSLIRIDGVEDFNYVNAVSGEVYKGFFVSPEDYEDLIQKE